MAIGNARVIRCFGLFLGLAVPLGSAALAGGTSAPHPASNPARTAKGGSAKPAVRPIQAAKLTAAAPAKLRYNRDVRPILAENCFACHGPDSAARKADLRIDRFAEATADRNGHKVIAPGNAAASELIKRVTGDGPVMPPKATKKELTPAQIAILKRWVNEGAEYEQHWSYIAPKKAPLPPVKDLKWCRNPIDRFILAKLEANGLKPAPEADRRTLARRLSLDLVGLPPDPAEVEAFVNDKAPDYYEKYVDKLMASPQWGEHRGRAWLDAARFADTHGIHFDNYREIWAYRDWVIKAFNQNMPFDQFTTEQLAGDLLPKPTLDQLVATGFIRCNITTNEGGAIAEEYLVLYDRDRTETLGQVWLGSTVGCAVCHDHKFDPFSQRDFYSLAAYFNNSNQGAMDGNIKDTPPIVMVPLEQDRARFDAIKPELETARTQTVARKQAARADFDQWLGAPDKQSVASAIPSEGLALHLPLTEGEGREVSATVNGRGEKLTAAGDPGWVGGHVSEKAFQRKPGGVIEVANAGDFEKDQSFSVAAWVKIPNAATTGSFLARMDDQHDYRGWDLWVQNGRVASHVINTWPTDAMKAVARDPLTPGKWHHVCVTYNGAGNVGGMKIYIDGVSRGLDIEANQLKGSIRTTVPLKIGQRHTGSAVEGTVIQDVRLYTRTLTDDEAVGLAKGTRAAYLVSKGGQLGAPEKDELFDWWLPTMDGQYREASKRLTALQNEEQSIRFRGTIAHVFNERNEEAMAYILARGEYDKRKEPVKPTTPSFLPAFPTDAPKNRLGLAKWLLLPEHPLTARVTVNRFWQEIFGTGIVKTAGDFGVAGEIPTHQELLDWLAVDLREAPGGKPWDIKRFFKLLVTSASYRQAANVTPEKRQKDPQNRLLSRGPRYRMDAEMVRDYALAASGLLVRKIGGPSVRPYQPDGVWEAVAMIGSNTRDYKRDTGENLYRRSMYTFWKRAAPPASMEIFNAPNRETCAVKRERTNTPLQALVTLNDIQFVEAARTLAQHALKDGGATPASRADYIARRLLARPFTAAEQPVVMRSLDQLNAFYASHGKEAKELITVGESKPDPSLQPEQLAAWTMLANQLMNLDEVLNK